MALSSRRRGSGVIIERTDEERNRKDTEGISIVLNSNHSVYTTNRRVDENWIKVRPFFPEDLPVDTWAKDGACCSLLRSSRIIENPEHLEKWMQEGAYSKLEHRIKKEIQQAQYAGVISEHDYILMEDSMGTGDTFDILVAHTCLNKARYALNTVLLKKEAERKAAEAKKEAETNAPIVTNYHKLNPIATPKVTYIDLPKYCDPVLTDNYLHRRYMAHLDSLGTWKGNVLDELPPLEWGNNPAPKMYSETKGGYRNRTNLRGLVLEHPNMFIFEAYKIVQMKDDQIGVSGTESIYKSDGSVKRKRRIVPIEELSYEGTPILDYIRSVAPTSIQDSSRHNEELFTKSEECPITERDDVYVHAGFGFVTLVRMTNNGKVIVRRLVDDERDLVGTKFDIYMEMHSQNAVNQLPGEMGVHIVEYSEIIPIKNLVEIGMNNKELYQVCNVRLATNDKEATIMARQPAKGLDEFVYIVSNLPLRPKLDLYSKVPVRDINGDLMLHNGQPILIHPQKSKIIKKYDATLNITVEQRVQAWEPPSVLVIGEESGKLSVVPAAWLYKLTGNTNYIPFSTTRSYDSATKRMVPITVRYPEIPSVSAWEDRNVFDHHLFTMKMRAAAKGKPEPGSFSILPTPAPGEDYRTVLPIREKFVNFEPYRWVDPKKQVNILDSHIDGYNPEDTGWDTEWQFRAHEPGDWIAEASIAEVFAVAAPSHERIMANTNQEAWYWTYNACTARQAGIDNLALNWTTPASNGIIATVTCNIDSHPITANIQVVKPGEIGFDAGLTNEQTAFILRFVSYKHAEARAMRLQQQDTAQVAVSLKDR